MENIGQTKPIDFEINNEVRGTFLLVTENQYEGKILIHTSPPTFSPISIGDLYLFSVRSVKRR